MKITPYTQAQATHFDREPAKGIAARVVIGKSDGANNFCMRVFEIAPGGHTPRHSHAWEPRSTGPLWRPWGCGMPRYCR